MSEIMRFEYIQEEYNDGDIYIPRREVSIVLDNEHQDGADEVLDSFKEFLVACGYQRETVDRIVFQPSEVVGEVN